MREEEGRNEPAPKAHVNGAGTAYADLKASSELLVKIEVKE